MTNDAELMKLIDAARALGAEIRITRSEWDGHVMAVVVEGLPGIGAYPMGPVSAAEKLREVLQ